MGCGERERSDRVSGNTEKHKENIGHSEGEREREKLSQQLYILPIHRLSYCCRQKERFVVNGTDETIA